MEGGGMSLVEELGSRGLLARKEGEALEVRPTDADDVRELIRTCRELGEQVLLEVDGLPAAPLWVPGSRGESVPNGEGIRVCVRLAQLKAFSLDRESHLVSVGAGVTVASLEEELLKQGFTLGFKDCPGTPIGAWLAAGEPGPGSRRSFPGWSPVAALEAVLLQGAMVRTTLAPRSATGPDPKALLVGGCGRLGVITKATLRVFPAARVKRLVMAFADVADAVGTVVEALGRQIVPDGFGLLDGGGSAETLLTWETSGEPGRVARASIAIDEVSASNGGRRLGSLVMEPGEEVKRSSDEVLDGSFLSGAAGPTEVRAAAARLQGKRAGTMIALGFGARWSRVLLVRRALINEIGPGARLHLERALPEGGLGIACVAPSSAEAAREAIRRAGGFPVGDEENDSWVDGVACALLGDAG